MKVKFAYLFALLAIFAAAPQIASADVGPLGGTSWHVVEYNNGKQAVSSVLENTEITAYFDMDGKLYGLGGCNNYTTAYSVVGGEIRISPVAATRKMCPRAGVMEQEHAYFNALEGTASWRISGNRLELLHADGTLAVGMTAAAPSDSTYLYKSGEREALIEMHGPDELMMTIDGATYRMKRALSASGAKYEDVSDPETVFWSKGNSATISVRGKDYPEFVLEKDAPSDDELYITIDGETFRMKRIVSASGARYEATDDPTTTFWSKGRNATLAIRGREYSKYVLLRNSPKEDELLLTVDGTNYRLRRVPAASGAKYEAVDDPTTVFWSKGDTATLTVRGKEYLGYDTTITPPAELPIGTLPTDVEWHVRSIAGKAVIPDSTVTLTFGKDGRLRGKASINNYMSSWIVVGDSLLISGGASTMMAGPPALMEQEQTFMKMLGEIRRFAIRDGDLVLIARDGREVVAKR